MLWDLKLVLHQLHKVIMKSAGYDCTAHVTYVKNPPAIIHSNNRQVYDGFSVNLPQKIKLYKVADIVKAEKAKILFS